MLDQILPVSFTMNLFFLTVLLGPEMPQTSTSTCWSAPGLMIQVLPLATFSATLFIAPFCLDTSALIPVVLLARLLLFLPFQAFRPNLISVTAFGQSKGDIFKKRNKENNFWLAYKPTLLTALSGYLCLRFVHALRVSTLTLPFTREILSAINNDSAVSALGYDLLIAMGSWAIWCATKSKDKVHAT